MALAAPLWLSSQASAYYFYVHYASRSAPYTQIVEKFDINSLSNKTVPVLVSDQGPTSFAPGDSYAALVSEVRAAAKVWNDVTTSDLRVSYAGLYSPSAGSGSAPVIQVDFSDDVTPGLIAMSGPEVRGATAIQSSGGRFVPIIRAKMLFRRDMSQMPSYSELFFTTAVHEFGHALGLQHTLTSSVMSTSTTSTSTRAAPLGPDDIAGISLLYPAPGYLGSVGSISGRVTLANGAGVNLASVVAISTSNPAVSTLTNPDGTFEIDGLAPQQYYIYVHPLPGPLQGESYPANITPPKDQNGAPIGSAADFTTQFYPGTRDFNQAQWVFVYANNVTSGVDFRVSQRTGTPISSVRVYGYSATNVPLTSPQIFVGIPAALVAGAASGLVQQNGTLAPGVGVGMLGTSASIYNLGPWYQQFASFDVMAGNAAGPGPKHLLFSSPSDIYVLPSGFTVVQNPPPAITSLTPATDSTGRTVVAIGGTNLQPDTRFYFDGIAAAIQGQTSDGRVMVIPPSAPGGYTASVVALNSSDSQSSLFLQSIPPAYNYEPSPNPVITVSPQFLTPGTDNSVDIVAANTNFVDGQVVAGFGTSDVVVKRIQVLSPTHLVVTATSLSGSFLPTSSLNITSGLRVMSQALGFPILPPSPPSP